MINTNLKISIKDSTPKPKINESSAKDNFSEVLNKVSGDKKEPKNTKQEENIKNEVVDTEKPKDIKKDTISNNDSTKEIKESNENNKENNEVKGTKNQESNDNKENKVKPEDLEGLLELLNGLMNVNSKDSMKNISKEDIKAIQSLMLDLESLLKKDKGLEKLNLKELGVDLSKQLNKLMENDEFKNKLTKNNLDLLDNVIKEISKEIKDSSVILTKDEEKSFKEVIEKLQTEIQKQKPSENSSKSIKNSDKNISLEDETTLNSNNVDKKITNVSNDKNFKENNQGEKEKPKDLMVKGEKEIQTKTASEDKVLDKILKGDGDNLDKFSLFQRRLDISKSMEVKPEVRAVDARNLREDIIRNVKFMVTNTMKELTVKVYPKELGAITISLTQSEGEMKAILKPTSKETYSMLMQNSDEMKKILGDQNIKISSVQISLYNDDTTFYKDSEFANGFMNDGGNKSGEERHNNKAVNNTAVSEDELSDEASRDRNVDMLA
ncbi:flagellar hook-length control protein FliK [Clostridium sp. LY3-2]|uniref:flagellar hook-length control protein FliK n=1 Tax=Clostridium sp. LY3-2 TaxID=2942482 RepID=UPI002152BD17|nr:flagellar hook-length control protein FliK [Clostridium sp. LY3-2]MCR6513557.1 flagellar hook-length control protein FliK [Clostridium sp. LY3-2]